MTRTLLITALAAVAISLPAAATGAPAATNLVGVVGPEMTITLRNADGSAVTHLDPGEFVISIDDKSILHNYHLFGPGVEQRTDIETIGMTSWTVQFTDGTYNFRCDAHFTLMKGSFTVGNVPPPPPPTPKLNGKVTAQTISLKSATGSKVRSLVEGKHRVTVNDSSNTQNFHLSGPGVNKKTGVKAKAKVAWTLTFGPGKYTYRSDKNRRLRGTFTVRAAPTP
jgi:plastocyanin